MFYLVVVNIILLYSNSRDDRKLILNLQLLALALIFFHFLLLGTNSLDIALGVVYMVKNRLSVYLEKEKRLIYLIWFLNFLVVAVFFDDLKVDSFALISLFFDTLYSSSVKLSWMRFFELCSMISLAIFSFLVLSYAGCFFSVMNILILLYKLIFPLNAQQNKQELAQH